MLDIIDLLFIGGLTNLAVEELGPGGIRLNARTPSPQERETQERETRERAEQRRETEAARLREATRLETERRKERERVAQTKREQWLVHMNQRYPGVRWR
jgi:hypothetical protein